ncbi:unnamed protein product [Callosobruchus maculatus]|uniref:Sulfatase N-terminal domain-containing protein n=2 Tax=Callosobruchus maculatus TaxID=64391 RepID=A0A653DMA8_CALMS|nr:unnamed protein product [Callosobruchus maculatus]
MCIKMKWWLLFMGLVLTGQHTWAKNGPTRPNVIVIVADDMGFNDVGFHGSNEIPTPNIDALGYNGVILNSHYTQALCTPSRSAFLTGKYPIHLGMQHLVILEPEPWGLPLNETLLPQHLKNNGYKTHAIGKWHLGFFRKEYTPTFRGFDTHYGYWQGLQDYYKHDTHATFSNEVGYDMRRGMEVDWSAKGNYSTTLFTQEALRLISEHDTSSPMFMYLAHLAPHSGNDDDPLQAPDEEIAKFAYIKDPERRIYAAMVSMLDQSVGTVVAALREKGMLDNSIILFMSDNGAKPDGIHANHGSNYPLRGTKNSDWEGGTRNIAAIWSPLIKKPQRVSNNLMHITDWLPTFYSAIGLNHSELGLIDGIDMWSSISTGSPSPRTEMVYNIDDVDNYGAIRKDNWKYTYGSTNGGKGDAWYGSTGRNGYSYDMNEILKSKVATTLAATVTLQQIAQKKGKNNISIELLDGQKIERLRNEATVKCSPPLDSTTIPEERKCDLMKAPCLFDIEKDPCEMVNLAEDLPIIASDMQKIIERYRRTALPPRNVPRDPMADPKFWNNTWTNWRDEEEISKRKVSFNDMSPLAVGIIAAAGIAVLLLIAFLLTLHCRKVHRKSPDPTTLVEESYQDPINARKSNDHLFEDRELQVRSCFKDEIRTME